ncbi:MAG: hypothetical protein AAB910_00265, partial [Patescibacteria group bacterium]
VPIRQSRRERLSAGAVTHPNLRSRFASAARFVLRSCGWRFAPATFAIHRAAHQLRLSLWDTVVGAAGA